MSFLRSNSSASSQQIFDDEKHTSRSSNMALTHSVAYVVALFHPRKPKQRTTFIALLILVCLSTYILIANNSSLSPFDMRPSDTSQDQLALALETIQNARLAEVSNKHGLKKGHQHMKGTIFSLNLDQELAAVASFIASLPQNVIPPTVDPSLPIDPQLVLDFDTRGPRAQEEVRAMVEEVWLRNPVFLFSKIYSPPSREIKTILSQLYLRPAPTIIDVDLREDVEILIPMLKRLTGFSEIPLLLIGGKPVGSMEQVKALHKSGELEKMITAAGSLINGAKKKKHRK